jgi:hypothetical protein
VRPAKADTECAPKSDAEAILALLTKVGCKLSVAEGSLRVEGSGAVPAALMQTARDCEAEIVALLTATPYQAAAVGDRRPLLVMSLDKFAREGQLLEVRGAWLEATLWFVPTKADAESLVRVGVSRGRIWTAWELMDLLGGAELRPEQVRAVALVKLEFAGEVVGARRAVRTTAWPRRAG